MKLWATVMLYNDRTFLAGMLDSVKDSVDRIVFCDGAYERYLKNLQKFDPSARACSTDGSLEMIQNFPNLPTYTIIHPPNGKPWINQNLKRTAMLNAVPDSDWFIGIDPDEMLKGDIDEGMEEIYESGCCVGQTPICNVGLDTDRMYPFWHPRVFEKQAGMHYYGTHWHLRDAFNRIIEEKYPVKWTDKFVLVHFKAFRILDRLIAHESYMTEMGDRGWIEPGTAKQPVMVT